MYAKDSNTLPHQIKLFLILLTESVTKVPDNWDLTKQQIRLAINIENVSKKNSKTTTCLGCSVTYCLQFNYTCILFPNVHTWKWGLATISITLDTALPVTTYTVLTMAYQ